MRFNRDTFTNSEPREVSVAAMAILNAIQDERPEVAVSAIAAAFLLAAERAGVQPQDAFTITKHIMNFAEGRRPEFAAVAQFLQEEWA